MNIINILLSASLVIFIIGAGYFIKIESKKNLPNKTPRFVSTKNYETNLRTGPNLDYPIIYTYHLKDMPLKVIDTYQEWYQIIDIYGQKGWVYKNLVVNQKNGVIIQEVEVKINNNKLSKIIAVIRPYNIIKIINCNSLQELCKIEFLVEGRNITYSGWIPKISIWGDTQ